LNLAIPRAQRTFDTWNLGDTAVSTKQLERRDFVTAVGAAAIAFGYGREAAAWSATPGPAIFPNA
jgi:hypothetical protein